LNFSQLLISPSLIPWFQEEKKLGPTFLGRLPRLTPKNGKLCFASKPLSDHALAQEKIAHIVNNFQT